MAYGAVVVTMAAGVGWLFTLGFTAPNDAAAIRLSGIVVVVIQLVGFGAIKGLGARQVMAGWGAAAALRFVALIVYSVLVAKVLVMPLVPALISMAAFFFLSTVIEPLFLRL
jgi:hypothetical protein